MSVSGNINFSPVAGDASQFITPRTPGTPAAATAAASTQPSITIMPVSFPTATPAPAPTPAAAAPAPAK